MKTNVYIDAFNLYYGPVRGSRYKWLDVRTLAQLKTEEKGSDVNLATDLLVDAFEERFEAAAVVTNDSDLLRPIATVRRSFGKTVGILYPHSSVRHPSVPLQREADFFKEIRQSSLAKCQFPDVLTDARGKFHKPPSW